MGGFATRMALLKEQMKKRPCERCGLHYDPDLEEQCPHCGHLDEKGLKRLLAQREREHAGIRQLGNKLIFSALILSLLMLFLFFAY